MTMKTVTTINGKKLGCLICFDFFQSDVELHSSSEGLIKELR